jgi:hypothetical protein
MRTLYQIKIIFHRKYIIKITFQIKINISDYSIKSFNKLVRLQGQGMEVDVDLSQCRRVTENTPQAQKL